MLLFFTFENDFFVPQNELSDVNRTYITHWEELLQSVSDFIFSKHYGCTLRGVRGVKRSEIL